MATESQVDVLIVGAGISGIGTAYHLQDKCPNKTCRILERRENLGTTSASFVRTANTAQAASASCCTP